MWIRGGSYRYAAESASLRRSPDILGVRVADDGGILAAAVRHQVIHVALPRHGLSLLSCFGWVFGSFYSSRHESANAAELRSARKWSAGPRFGVSAAALVSFFLLWEERQREVGRERVCVREREI